jgi:hypothetical protein
MEKVENKTEFWGQLQNEPIDWYLRFVQFYLPGIIDEESLSVAYTNYLQHQKTLNDPIAIKALKNNSKVPAPIQWIKIAIRWQWRERSEAFKTQQAKLLLEAEKQLYFDIVERRIKLVLETLDRHEILSSQFKHNYGFVKLDYEKTIDGVNIAKIDSILTESNEKAINQYLDITGIKDLLLEKQQNE